MCPAGYVLSTDNRFCEPEVIVQAPIVPPVPAFGRRKDVSLVSISPLDRLLGQDD
jgi:hypothetical protein